MLSYRSEQVSRALGQFKLKIIHLLSSSPVIFGFARQNEVYSHLSRSICSCEVVVCVIEALLCSFISSFLGSFRLQELGNSPNNVFFLEDSLGLRY